MPGLWQFFVSVIEYASIILFAFMLFRQKIKPYFKEIALVALIGAGCHELLPNPFVYVIGTVLLFVSCLKFAWVPSILISLAGYVVASIIQAAVFAGAVRAELISPDVLQENLAALISMHLLAALSKLIVLCGMLKYRWGFTFLSRFTRINFNKENAGVYVFILVAVVGLLVRTFLHTGGLKEIMPIQTMSAAAVVLFYITLRKELGL